ncbi:DnaD domain-containing protein [Metabacillus endolithicus]|uniref:DnaD domain-containing protein n=1 Tax=Metabacillus endolithicus TaxID=1535204 RepID=A0ABW5BPZ6_9BACI|nr:DnaD domain protein [Metabacillus endolithicus]UPG63794.1 DnaD domain protein [Metabacillus endolithicus]
MAKFRMVLTGFWRQAFTLEKMTTDDKLFYIYLLTNEKTTQVGIYEITKKEMAFETGYSIEFVESLLKRFTELHKLIRYNPETCEIAIKDWGKYNLHKGGKPMLDCIKKELKEVKDTSLLSYVCEGIEKEEFVCLFDSYIEQDDEKVENNFVQETETDVVVMSPDTSSKKKDNDFNSKKEDHSRSEDEKEIIEFWDNNGFGYSNVNAKEQLLTWLDDSSFLHPKEVVVKALGIACANNKRRLNYVSGILKNWKNESLLSVDEIDSYLQKHEVYRSKQTKSIPERKAAPKEFVLDLTAGEENEYH